jgi:hypothetical protein
MQPLCKSERGGLEEGAGPQPYGVGVVWGSVQAIQSYTGGRNQLTVCSAQAASPLRAALSHCTNSASC